MLISKLESLPNGVPPFLRWAGSKRRLLPTLRKYWKSSHQRYLEPFAGSACLFFDLNPPKAILGDLNSDLIEMYIEVKYRLDAVMKELRKFTPTDQEAYLSLRAADPEKLTSAQSAARFIYLNRFCFNGIYRTNSKGQFNVPYGGARSGQVPDLAIFQNCARRLRKASFVKGDFEKVLSKAKRGDLVYMDPPFAVKARRVFKEYNPAAFGDSDIKRLRSRMLNLNRGKINFVVSYAESDEADLLRKGFDYETVQVRRNIAGFAASRALTNEIIISNF